MPLTKEKMRDYMRERRKKKYAESQPEEEKKDEETGRYPDRTYNEDGSLVLFEQRCPIDTCKGIWSASIQIPCPYCKGTGNRNATMTVRR